MSSTVFQKNNLTKPARFPKPSRFEREIIFMNIYSHFLILLEIIYRSLALLAMRYQTGVWER
jgi:hypothetical protein